MASLEDLAEIISQAVVETTNTYWNLLFLSLQGHAIAVTSGLCSHRLGYGSDQANDMMVCIVQNGHNYENEVAMLTYKASEFNAATIMDHIRT